MKTSGWLGWAVGVLVAGGVAWGSGADPVAQARAAAGELGRTLKARLLAAMEQGGPEAGITVCAEVAEDLAREVSGRVGVEVRRTSDRARNPANQATDWRRTGLAALQAQLDGGVPSMQVAWTETTEQEVRVMLPIVTEPLCLTCHGAELAPGIATALQARYPDDRATGYAAGELRGAFTVRWPVDG